jgi:hypothetical protein
MGEINKKETEERKYRRGQGKDELVRTPRANAE